MPGSFVWKIRKGPSSYPWSGRDPCASFSSLFCAVNDSCWSGSQVYRFSSLLLPSCWSKSLVHRGDEASPLATHRGRRDMCPPFRAEVWFFSGHDISVLTEDAGGLSRERCSCSLRCPSIQAILWFCDAFQNCAACFTTSHRLSL